MQQNPAVELPIADVPIGVVPGWRQTLGRMIIVVASLVAAIVLAVQLLRTFGLITVGFENWRPVAVDGRVRRLRPGDGDLLDCVGEFAVFDPPPVGSH